MNKAMSYLTGEIERLHTQMEEDSAVLSILNDLLEYHGKQVPGVDMRITGACLMKMVPRFQYLITVVQRDMDNNLEELGKVFDALHEISRGEMAQEPGHTGPQGEEVA